MPPQCLVKIISGGQTGVDRAALDVAIFLDIQHGGWCPLNRRSEDGTIPAIYQLIETDQRDYSVRTEKNVVDADATLILYCKQMSGGTALTCRFASSHGRPVRCVDLSTDQDESQSVANWIEQHNIGVLNVAGPRESSSPGISKLAESFLLRVLANRSS